MTAVSAVDEPGAVRRTGRVRQRRDLIRAVATLAALLATLAFGQIGVHTASGLESDLHHGTALAFTGVAKPEAVVAVLAYRLLTTYLPAAPGYACLRMLRRQRAV